MSESDIDGPSPVAPTSDVQEKEVGSNLWLDAHRQLHPEERELIQTTSDDVQGLTILTEVQQLAEQKPHQAESKAWKIEFGGRRFLVTDLVKKFMHWIKCFKDIGDTLVTIDPIHTALPWATIKFLMEVRSQFWVTDD